MATSHTYRGAILVTSAHDEQGIEAMLSTVEQTYKQHNRWISFKPAILQGTTWQPFTPPVALQERFHRLECESVALSYGQQKQLMDKKFDAEDQDIFVASCMVAETKDGKMTTMATWTKGVTHALLPVADCIVFVVPDAQSLFVPWDRARELVSHLMLPTEWVPVRYEIREFPDDQGLEALRAVARPSLG